MSLVSSPHRNPRLYTESEVHDLFFASLKPKLRDEYKSNRSHSHTGFEGLDGDDLQQLTPEHWLARSNKFGDLIALQWQKRLQEYDATPRQTSSQLPDHYCPPHRRPEWRRPEADVLRTETEHVKLDAYLPPIRIPQPESTELHQSPNYTREQLTQLVQAAIARESFGVNPKLEWADNHHLSIEADVSVELANRIKADDGRGVDPAFKLSLLVQRPSPFLKYRLHRTRFARVKEGQTEQH